MMSDGTCWVCGKALWLADDLVAKDMGVRDGFIFAHADCAAGEYVGVEGKTK